MIEAVDPIKIDPISMSDTCKVFDCWGLYCAYGIMRWTDEPWTGNMGKDGDMLRTSIEKMATYIGT